MKLSKLSTALLAGSLLTMGMTAKAEEASGPFTTSGSIAFTSDYFYRGVSQTSSTSAIQGALTLSHESGLYATVWSSSIAFAQGQELDPAIGFAGSAGDLGYDVGILQYGYPGDRSLGFREAYGSVSYKGGKFGLAYSDDFFGGTGASLYSYLDYSTEVSGVGLVAHVGLNKFDDAALDSVDGYLDYKLGVSKEFAGLAFELAYFGSNLDDADCAAFSGVDDKVCSGKAVVTVSKSF